MYCTLTDLEGRHGAEKIGNWSPTETSVDAAITRATAEIDGYVSKRYPTPIDPVPGNVRDYCVSLAVGYLLTAIGVNDDSADKALLDEAKQARSFFEGVARGTYDLPVTDQSGSATPDPSPVRVQEKSTLDLRGY